MSRHGRCACCLSSAIGTAHLAETKLLYISNVLLTNISSGSLRVPKTANLRTGANMLSFAFLMIWLRLLLFISTASTQNTPYTTTSNYWVANIPRQGKIAFGNQTYQIFRNVKAFGAKGAYAAPFCECVQS